MDSLIYSLSKISLLRALVKYYYDHLDRQSSMWGRGGVTYLYVGDVFLYPLALSMPFCNKKLHSTRAMESRKLFIVVKFILCDFLQLVSSAIFCCKLAYLEPRGITKTSPTYKYVTPPQPHLELLCLSR